jgi:prolyl-tRNA synthetase
MASVCEEKHDQYGPIWPITIAPWEVEICALRCDNAQVKAEAASLYDALTRRGAEVLLDDRAVSAGFMFSDADLFGCPVRVIISPKTLGRGVIELVTRDKSLKEDVALADAPARIMALIQELKDQIWAKVPESI